MTTAPGCLRAVAVLCALIAVASLGFGYQVGVGGVRRVEERNASVRSLPVITRVAQIDAGLVGRHVLVDGQIAADNPSREFAGPQGEPRQFVVYRTGQLHRSTPNAQGEIATTVTWGETVAPQVAVQLEDGVARIAPGHYEIDNWRTYGVPGADATVGGYAVGDRVLIAGTVIQGADGPTIAASELSTHSAASYISAHTDQRSNAFYAFAGQVLAAFGAFWALIAALCAGGWAWLAARARREAAATLAPRAPGRAT